MSPPPEKELDVVSDDSNPTGATLKDGVPHHMGLAGERFRMVQVGKQDLTVFLQATLS
jgi:hypothetical protein